MSVRVLFFGATADLVGTRELYVESPPDVESLLERLADSYPKLASHKLLVSVDQEYARSDHEIKDGVEIAIFTAVSGG